MTISLAQIIPVLQGAIGPVILISGIGLLLLCMTNRMGRILDRARALAHQHRTNSADRHPCELELIRMLRRRALLNRTAIGLASLSILFVSTLILLLFVQALFAITWALPVIVAFSLCVVCLVDSVGVFIWDIHLSVVTLEVELDDDAEQDCGS